MMEAIYDKNVILVGWLDTDSNMLFNTDMIWVGFISNGNVFSTHCNWIGGYMEYTFVDKHGKPVAWVGGHNPIGTLPLLAPLKPLRPLTPLRPLRPLTPLRPLSPLIPLGGWSTMSWKTFLEQ